MRLHRSIGPSKCDVTCVKIQERPFTPNFTIKGTADASPFLVKVADYLFLGSIEAAYDEPLLCRNRIDALVDVSALRSNEVASHRKSSCPCACPLQTAHSRAKLAVSIQDREDEDILPFLSDINIFIHASRKKQRNVLVFSDLGRSRAPTAIIQYLIQFENACLSQLLDHISSMKKIQINKGFLKTLKKLERKIRLLPIRNVEQSLTQRKKVTTAINKVGRRDRVIAWIEP